MLNNWNVAVEMIFCQKENNLDKRGIFARYHNSIVGHFGAERTLNALSLGGHGWAGILRDVTRMISECSKFQ